MVIEPKDMEKDAIILEFKVHDPEDEETLKDTVQSALTQIEERQYAAQLISRGIPPVRERVLLDIVKQIRHNINEHLLYYQQRRKSIAYCKRRSPQGKEN